MPRTINQILNDPPVQSEAERVKLEAELARVKLYARRLCDLITDHLRREAAGKN